MKRSIFLILIVFSISQIKAQGIKGELGLTLGTSYYMGDVNHSKQFYSPKLAFGILYRRNLNEHYALRANIMSIMLSGNDKDFKNGYQQFRGHNFSHNIYEISELIEFNFFSFNPRNRKYFSPYITGGIAMTVSPSSSNLISIALPMGVGFKYAFNKKMTLSIEWVFRKSFSDDMDLLNSYNEDNVNTLLSVKQISKEKNSDWYSFAGIVLTYNITSNIKWCPAYGKKKRNNGF